MRRALVCGAALLAACSRAPTAPPDAGTIDARTLLEVALDARSTLAEPRFRVQLRADIAAAMARGDVSTPLARAQLDEALTEARALTDAVDRDRVLSRIARVYLALGQRDPALQIAATVRGPDDRAELMAELVADVPSALALTVVPERDRALARLAREAITAGDLDQAGQIAARITDGSVSAPVLGALCGALMRTRPVDAKRMVGQLEGLARSEAASVLALDAAKKGDLKQARRHADGIEDEVVRTRTLAQLGAAQPGGSYERKRWMGEALRTALDVRSTPLRTSAIEAMVRVMVQSGDPLGADTVMGTALAAPVRSDPTSSALDAAGARRVRALVAQGYAAEKDTVSAARVAGAIDDPVHAADAWAAIAVASSRAGLREAALAAAARIVPDELRMPVIAEIAVAPGPPPTPELRAALTSALARTP